jgi:uncharacterized circularly permuted ATP-grasp superfamily protein
MTEPDNTGPASLFDPVRFPAGTFCEAFGPQGVPRGHWQPLMAALDAIAPSVLDQRQERVRRMRHEDGAPFNPFDAPSGRGTPCALDMIPLPITAGEWADLEAGLIQRATLLERILADVYGPQNLLHQGGLPAELIYANPHFLRPCHGIVPAGNRYLTYYAADLYRAADGRFRVLRDWGGNPAGLGYALENRIVISRVFSELYHRTQIRRLAPFFQTFHNSMAQRAARRRQDPGIVLLSPGPDSRIYFEHALLSRYLGYPLVEGQDLTVRNGEVFLKKLAGLEPVETIVRHIADESSDPFALRRETGNGVAGLIQACREQQVDVVNPIGSGFVDTPVLPVFLPALCRQLMDADQILASHPAWWCGNDDGRTHVLANLERLDIQQALEKTEASEATPQGRDDLAARISVAPHLTMAREPVRPATVPAWNPDSVGPRHALLRVFVCATEEGFAVMPGGLAIQEAARNVRDRLSLDSWRVINRLDGFADAPAGDPLDLLEETLFTLSAFSGLAMESITRGLGWRFMDMGRRVERAINQTKLIRLGLPRVCADSRSALEALLEISDSIMTYRARYRTAFQLAPVMDLLVLDESNPKSLTFQCSQIASHVEELPRQDRRRFATGEERLALEMLTAVRLLDLSGLDCREGNDRHAALEAFLTTLEGHLTEFAQQVSAHYLSRVPTTPHFSSSRGEPLP